MQQPTDTPATPASPREWAHCAWHGAMSDTARLVQIIEQGSGPGANLFACAPCREVYRLAPIADQP
ncbi:hypothetical protein ACIRPX_05125 [Streptomyces sp. NPDC101225]|uniref:hypothetical protein n=1 Tax=Streptomyces sp. NPDC101225 TaxID=3366135 RepID=UPI0038305075